MSRFGSLACMSVAALLLDGLAASAQTSIQRGDALPPGLRDALEAQASADEFGLHPDSAPGASRWVACNPVHGLRVTFDEDGISVGTIDSAGPPQLVLQLRAWKRAGQLQLAEPARLEADGARISYLRSGLVEWYVNGPQGLEQGFTISAASAGDDAAPIELRMALQGALTPRLDPDRKGLTLHGAKDGVSVSYAGLSAWDADGEPLGTWLELSPGAISIMVDATGANYPLTIDPLIATEQGKLTASQVAYSSYFGEAVDVDGDIAVVGSRYHDHGSDSEAGSAYVFKRAGGATPTWHLQAILFAGDAAADDSFGDSVAVSGTTVIVGAPDADLAAGSDAGAAYVFTPMGPSWQQSAKLTASDAGAGDRFGSSVALKSITAVIGAERGDDTGTAYVFVSGATWTQQAKLIASDAGSGDRFGAAVAVFADTAVIGAYMDDTSPAGPDAGSAYVFVRSGTVWTQQAKLVASDAFTDDEFGRSVDYWGDSIVVGAPEDDHSGTIIVGSAYVFVRSGSIWTQQAKLIASDPALGDEFGWSVSLDFNTAAIGARNDTTPIGNQAGSAYVFVRSGTTWSQQAKLTDSGASPYDQLGTAAALSGETLVVGARWDDVGALDNAGSASIYLRTGTSWGQQDKVIASDVEPSAGFGGDIISEVTGGGVSISGDTAIVGVPWDDHANLADAGSAWIFVREGASWSAQARLTASDAAANRLFGQQVAISGDTALGAANDGSVYVFVRSGTTWSQQQKLSGTGATAVALSGDTAVIGAYWGNNAKGTATVFQRTGTTWSQQGPPLTAGVDATDFDWFGWSVAVSGDTLVVGSIYDWAPNPEAGAAHVFVRNGTTWTQQGPKLTAGADASVTKAFGSAVSVSGDTVLVGAKEATVDGLGNAGAAYVFVRVGTTWSQQGPRLTADEPESGDQLGSSVSLTGGLAILGAEAHALDLGAAGVVPGVGAAYVFARSGSTWNQVQKLTPPDATTPATAVSGFGACVALDDDTVIVGAPNDDVDDGTGPATNSGSAYAIRLGADWLDLGGGVPGTKGPLVFAGYGPLVEGTTVTSILTGALPNSVATHVVGLTLISAPFKGGIWGPALDSLIPGIPTDAFGSIVLSAVWPPGIPSGTTVYAQYWMADPGAVKNFAGSNTIAGTTP